jgi:hypothetical protein
MHGVDRTCISIGISQGAKEKNTQKTVDLPLYSKSNLSLPSGGIVQRQEKPNLGAPVSFENERTLMSLCHILCLTSSHLMVYLLLKYLHASIQR